MMTNAPQVAPSCATWTGLESWLLERVEALARPHVFALLDQNCPVPTTDPLHPECLSTREPVAESMMLACKGLVPDPRMQPRLLALRTPGDRGYPDTSLLQLTLDNALARRASINGAHVCGWLVSDHPLTDLASHLRHVNPLRDPANPPHAIAAWFQPHRLALIGELASPAFVDALLGNVDTWLFVDSAGVLQALQRSDTTTKVPGLIGLPSAEHWAAQSRVRTARQVLMAMVKAGHTVPDRAELAIDHALRQAAESGMVRVEDVICFALNQVTVSPQWHRHPAAIDLLAKVVRQEAFLSDGLQALPAYTLNEIAGMADRSPPAAS